MPVHFCTLLLALFFGSALLQPVWGQFASYKETTVYRHAPPGQATIAVNVWGAVLQPGRYEVAPSTDLLTLLSLAGGPVMGTPNAQEKREMRLLVTRLTGTERKTVLHQQLGALLGEASAPFALMEGDVIAIEVQSHQKFSWRDGLTAVSAIGAITINVLYILLRN